MYCVVKIYEVIDHGKHYSPKDAKYNDLSVDVNSCLNRYMGCGLLEFLELNTKSNVNDIKTQQSSSKSNNYFLY